MSTKIEMEEQKMNEKEIIIKLMEEQGLSIADLASMMGISSAALWDRIKSPKNKSLTTKKLNEILMQLKYEIVLMPRAKASNIQGAYVVKPDGGDKK
jgi:predicted DNA-binding protein (UPF0251 family)